MTRKQLLLIPVVVVFVLLLTPSALAQNCPNCCLPPCVPQSGGMTINQTYSGWTYFSFPNYDIYAFGAPRNTTDLIQGTGSGRSIIFHNQAGLRWDGSAFVDHPAYHHGLVTRYQYRNRNLGTWPTPFPPTSVTTLNQNLPLPNTLPPRRAEPVRTTMTFVAPPWVVREANPSKVSTALPPNHVTTYDSHGSPHQPVTTGRVPDASTPNR